MSRTYSIPASFTGPQTPPVEINDEFPDNCLLFLGADGSCVAVINIGAEPSDLAALEAAHPSRIVGPRKAVP